jgi:hypothetical protein
MLELKRMMVGKAYLFKVSVVRFGASVSKRILNRLIVVIICKI